MHILVTRSERISFSVRLASSSRFECSSTIKFFQLPGAAVRMASRNSVGLVDIGSAWSVVAWLTCLDYINQGHGSKFEGGYGLNHKVLVYICNDYCQVQSSAILKYAANGDEQ